MQYIVIWAGDIPAEARWYIERGRHGWWALAWLLYGLQGVVSFAALLSNRVRSSRRAMMALAALTLVMRLVEQAWLVLPGMKGIGWPVVPLMVAASLAMLGFGWFGAVSLRRHEELWSEPEWVGKARSV
jgi:sugar phosphate permease